MAILLQGCYETLPLQEGPPPATAGVQLVLNDKGRDEVSTMLGSAVDRVEGTVIAQNSDSYTLAVSQVYTLGGSSSKWAGEKVTIDKDGTRGYQVHRFNEARTLVLAAVITGAAVAFLVGAGLAGSAVGSQNSSSGHTGQQH
jgi:hypothetical protein